MLSSCFVSIQEFTPSPEGYGKAVTMGDFVRDVFLEQVNRTFAYKKGG